MIPAIRVAGRRRSIRTSMPSPKRSVHSPGITAQFKRQEEGPLPPTESADTASAQGLLSTLGNTLSGALQQAGNVASGLPIIGGLGILSADGSNPGTPPPRQKRDGADTASAQGLLGSLGDTLDGALHQAGDAANGLPVVGGLGILSTQKRDEADTASAQGLLGSLGDTLGGALHQASDAANGLPVVGGLGILSTSDSSPQKRDDGASGAGVRPDTNALRDPNATLGIDAASAQGVLGNVGETLSSNSHGFISAVEEPPIVGSLGILPSSVPDPAAVSQGCNGVRAPSMSTDQLNAFRQQIATVLRQQQAEQVATTLSTASPAPVHSADLQKRLLAIQNAAQGTTEGLDLPSLLGQLPVAGPLASTITGLPAMGGVLSSAEGVAEGLPVAGSSAGGTPGGGGEPVAINVAGTVGGLANGITGTASGLPSGVTGANSNMFQNTPGVSSVAAPQGFASIHGMHWPDATGFYPHTLADGSPVAPPNSPAFLSPSVVYGPFGMDASGVPPAVPPPSPASGATSVPMGHDGASASSIIPPAGMISMIPAPSTSPSIASEGPLGRRRVDGDVVGEAPSQVQPDDDAEGFSPSTPDATYTPPLLASSKRSAIGGVADKDSKLDAVPRPRDKLSRTLKSQRQVKMFRRLLRGASVSF